jgi:putative SOS response-associated peptidase YedK
MNKSRHCTELSEGHQIRFATINAMAETVPVFRKAFRRRRCLVPIEAFYEWKKFGPKKKRRTLLR